MPSKIHLHPNTLTAQLKMRGQSQKALAQKMKVTADTVNRWATGRSGIRKEALLRLAKTLDVQPEVLIGSSATTVPEKLPRDEQLNVRVTRDVRNKLLLTCERYRVTQATLVELAPLMFVVLAELSLRARAEAILAVKEAYDRAAEASLEAYERAAKESHSHILSPTASVRIQFNYMEAELLAEEEQLIEARNLFGVQPWQSRLQEGTPNLFLRHLKMLAADLPASLVEIDDSSPDRQRYSVADETLRQVSGIDGDDPEATQARGFIHDGSIELREVQEKRKALSEDAYRAWVDAKRTEIVEEREAYRNSPEYQERQARIQEQHARIEEVLARISKNYP